MTNLPAMAVNLLTLEWVQLLASQELGIVNTQTSGKSSRNAMVESSWRFTNDDQKGFSIVRSNDDSSWRLEVDSEFDRQTISSIFQRACEAADKQDTGQDIYHEAVLTSPAPDINSIVSVQLIRLIEEGTVISGERRILLDRVLLDFQPESVDNNEAPWAPSTMIKVCIFAPGPCPGPFTNKIVEDYLEMARLICSFAMGRPVDRTNITADLISEERAGEARSKRYDRNILTLAKKGISTDLFEVFTTSGEEAMLKLRGALVAYDAAIRQTNSDIATILLVAGMESLCVPNADWRTERAVTRFINAGLSLCPDTIDEIIANEYFESAFNLKRKGSLAKRRRSVMNKVYDLRSRPVHSGPGMMIDPMSIGVQPGTQRVALLAHLLSGMWLSYAQAPRSFLTGHPQIAPSSSTSTD